MPLKASVFRFLGTHHLILVFFALLLSEVFVFSDATLIALEWSDYNERTCTYNIVVSLILTQVKNIYSCIQVTRNIINDDSIYRMKFKKNVLHTSFRFSRGIFIKWWIWAFLSLTVIHVTKSLYRPRGTRNQHLCSMLETRHRKPDSDPVWLLD